MQVYAVFLTFPVACAVIAGGAYAMRWTRANAFRLHGARLRRPTRNPGNLVWAAVTLAKFLDHAPAL